MTRFALLLPVLASCGSFAGVETTIESSSRPASSEIVLPTTRCGDYFIAEAMIDGEGPFRLLLDTGFPRTQLSRATANALGVRRSVRSIEVGGFRAAGRIRIGVRDLDLIGRALGSGIDGILGYTLLSGSLLTYDFPASEIRVGSDSIPAGGLGVLRLATGERPFVYGRIGADSVRFVLDTGFSGALALAGFDERAGMDSARLVGARMRVDGIAPRRGMRLAEDVVIGPLVIRTPVVIDAASPRSLLGQGILRDHVVVIDRARGRARIRSPDGTAPASVHLPPLYGTGMVLVPRRGHYEVAHVIHESASARAGVVAGDRVIEVDGIPVGERGCRAREDTGSPSPRSYTILRDGIRLEVRIGPGVLVR